MLKKVINGCVNLVQRYLPEPFIFAIILTLVAIAVAMPLCHQTPLEVVEHWGQGVWSLLAFAMQMALVLVCGATLADSALVKKGLRSIASLPKTPAGAIALVTGVSAVACWVNWGFGLIIGVIFAKEIAFKLKGVDYRLLIASAYSGFVVWHAGVSGSIPLAMATRGAELTEITGGILTQPIPLSQTVFATYNLLIAGGIIVALMTVNALMHPKGSAVLSIAPELLANELADKAEAADTAKRGGATDVSANTLGLASAKALATPAQKMENSRLLSTLIALLGLTYLFIHLFVRGKSLDLNGIIMLFLFVGILIYKTPMGYVKAFGKAASGAAGILLQFPFYAGIMGIITGTGASGINLGGVLSDAFIAISNPQTFPVFSFLSAAIINLFVPSGGGQWAVQAPIMFPAGAGLGVNPALTGMAIAWGDAWTNLIQPFWAIPALAIARLNAKDIMGFCLIDLLVSGAIICGGLLLVG